MSGKSRRGVLRGIATSGIGVTTIAGSAAASQSTTNSIVVEDYFHNDIDGWEVGRDLPEGTDGEPIDSHVTHTNRGSASGYWGGCVEFGLEGSQDDGTIWLQQPIDVDPNTTYDVTLEFAGYNKQQSYNKIVAGHAILTNDKVQVEDDLRGRNSSNAVHVEGDVHQADDQWLYYDTAGEFDSDGSSTAWLAFGVDLFWESDYWSNRFDDVSVELTPK